jgi:hypothetical protein
MVMCGYSEEEMEQITDLHEKEYWRLWNRLNKCEHTDEYWDECCTCTECGKTYGVKDEQIIEKLIVREQKIIHNAIDLIISLQERRDVDCDEIKKILFS